MTKPPEAGNKTKRRDELADIMCGIGEGPLGLNDHARVYFKQGYDAAMSEAITVMERMAKALEYADRYLEAPDGKESLVRALSEYRKWKDGQ